MQAAAFARHLHRLALAEALQGRCPHCTVPSVPIIGEVPKRALESQQRFWLDASQSRVPQPYQHPGHTPHLDSLPTLYGAMREDTGYPITGSWAARKLRYLGFLPALLDSLPVGQAPRHLVLSAGQVSTAFQQFGATLTNRLMLLHLVSPRDVAVFNRPAEDARAYVASHGMPQPQHTFQVLVRRLSVDSHHGDLEAVTLINCPSTRIVESRVPVEDIHADESPAARRGGFALIVKKVLRVRSLVTNIPLTLPIDCATFEPGAKVFARDLRLAEGQHLVGVSPDTCILKMEFGGGE